MTIYTTLYIKRHTKTGLMYFGKTTKSNPYKYRGSGKYWLRHVELHGSDQIETVWVSQPFSDVQELQEFALAFSELFDIVESPLWANLQEENGLDGGLPGSSVSQEKRERISKKLKGIKRSEDHILRSMQNRPANIGKLISEGKLKSGYVHSEESRKKMSQSRTGVKASEESRKARSERLKGKEMRTSVCPHCGKEGNFMAMSRWHFDNCKHKP